MNVLFLQMFSKEPTDPEDPRHNPKHKERGEARYSYTYRQLSKLLGLRVVTLYSAQSRGDFDIKSIESVAHYICLRQGWTPKGA